MSVAKANNCPCHVTVLDEAGTHSMEIAWIVDSRGVPVRCCEAECPLRLTRDDGCVVNDPDPEAAAREGPATPPACSATTVSGPEHQAAVQAKIAQVGAPFMPSLMP